MTPRTTAVLPAGSLAVAAPYHTPRALNSQAVPEREKLIDAGLRWKPDWSLARRAMIDWWHGKGFALHVSSPKDVPWADIPPPPPSPGPMEERINVGWRTHSELYRMSRTFFGGVAAPVFNANIGGPGSLGLFLGAEGHADAETVWYEPCIDDPETHPSLRFDRENRWWRRHLATIDEALRVADGRYVVGVPDLIENIDTLAQLRGSEQTLMDLLERPEWVEKSLREINRAFFDCFDALWERLRDPWGGNMFTAFQLWGPGKTAKVQCDFSCMISPAMFRRFVVPPLAEQCEWLDFAMYHLDGTQAIAQLDNLLAIDAIRAIEWTPQAGLPRGGSPRWYDLYRRIKAAGKSVQAVEVAPADVLPLIDAVGPEGLFIITETETERQTQNLLTSVGWSAA